MNKREVRQLVDKLLEYQKAYYVDAHPLVSDLEYDRLFDELKRIEKSDPSLVFPDSPTLRVGSDLSNDFPEVRHTIPVLSLDKAYKADEVLSFFDKNIKKENNLLSFVAEEKIDGISMVLYYENGLLVRAVTRGNGEVGNDVGVVMGLQVRSRNGVCDGSFHAFLHHLGLFFAPSDEVNLLGSQNGGDTHGDGADRCTVNVSEYFGGIVARSVVEQNQSRSGVQAGARLVETDISHTSDAQQGDVQSTETLDTLLVEAAIFEDGVFGYRAVGTEDVLFVYVHMVE